MMNLCYNSDQYGFAKYKKYNCKKKRNLSKDLKPKLYQSKNQEKEEITITHIKDIGCFVSQYYWQGIPEIRLNQQSNPVKSGLEYNLSSTKERKILLQSYKYHLMYLVELKSPLRKEKQHKKFIFNLFDFKLLKKSLIKTQEKSEIFVRVREKESTNQRITKKSSHFISFCCLTNLSLEARLLLINDLAKHLAKLIFFLGRLEPLNMFLCKLLNLSALLLILVPLIISLPHPHHDVHKRSSFFDIDCKGVFNKSIFFRLDRICEDCYSLFREVELHSLCKKQCFTTEFFKGCLEALQLQDEVNAIKSYIKLVNGADPNLSSN
ncbi:CLUMA_CG010937, isoform A [Clunio marinus]|uniref:CLUMA_CG010937, isoform A n=1 Tax=Clunio marinus TaxID=568069 RepID=A0A1J1IB91_9DIPT|nr:CLUMA_CG010937, isoform A [Clunio marinus]